MNDTLVTVVGNVVDSPRRNRLDNGAVTNFRMAATARRFDPTKEAFVDGTTFWVDVACWGDLGGNVSLSLAKGDPVIVRGMLYTDSWETETGRRSTPRIRAIAVGPNLARGSSVFKRAQRAPDGTEAAASGPLPPVEPPAEEDEPSTDYEKHVDDMDREPAGEPADEPDREPALA